MSIFNSKVPTMWAIEGTFYSDSGLRSMAFTSVYSTQHMRQSPPVKCAGWMSLTI